MVYVAARRGRDRTSLRRPIVFGWFWNAGVCDLDRAQLDRSVLLGGGKERDQVVRIAVIAF